MKNHSQQNSYNFLRLLFAILVIITHAYPLTGLEECDLLCKITKGQMVFSNIGLAGFFSLSGYLIYQSAERSKNWIDYMWRRCLRIFPALAVVLIITILILPLFYISEIPYWQNSSVWTYFPFNMSLFFLQFSIPGVFDFNPVGGIVNGSLWTLAYEFSFYILVSFFVFIRKKNPLKKTGVLFLFIAFFIGNVFFKEIVSQYGYILSAKWLLEFGCYFFTGMLIYEFKLDRWVRKPIVLVFLFLTIGLSLFFQTMQFVPFLLCPFIIGIGSFYNQYINKMMDKLGDISYGVYIYGFPVQQALVFSLNLNYIALIFATLPIVFVLGYLSWHLIEKRAMNYKTMFK